MLKRLNLGTCLAALLGGLSALAQAAAPSPDVRLNSVGLRPDLGKRAVVLGATSALSFSVKRSSDDAILYSGTLGPPITVAENGLTVRQAVFDGMASTVRCYVDVSGIGRSVDVNVAPDAYNQALTLNLFGFFQQRCGISTVSSWQGQTWGHPICHQGDAGQTYYTAGVDTSVKDATGGWHDAGDYNKYSINAAAALGPMLHAWERHQGALQGLTTSTASDPTLPDYLEELKWELNWLRKMQFSDGRVSDKVTVWGGFETYWVTPDQHLSPRYLTPAGTGEAACLTAVLACASRVFQPYDSAYAAALLSQAQLSYSYLQSVTYTIRANISGAGTGDYTHSNDSGDRLWAAAELWETTGSASYLTDAETRLSALADKYDAWIGWAKLWPLGSAVYALSNRSGRNGALLTAVRNAITSDAGALVGTANAHGFARAASNSYYWGANGQVAMFGYSLDAAYILSGNSSYLTALQSQLSWLYGCNQYDRSQVTGLGLDPPLDPHDRDSSNDLVSAPRPGHLVGGGTSATNWVDSYTDASLNEIAINWDAGMTSSLAALVAWYGASPTPTPTITATPSISPTFTQSPTVTESPTISPTFSESPTFTVSPTATESYTASPTFTVSPTPSVTPSFTATPTAVPAPSTAPKVLRAQAAPNPVQRPMIRLRVQLEGPASSLRYHLYSAAYSSVRQEQVFGSFSAGWNELVIAAPELPPGLYYGKLSAQGGGQDGALSQGFRIYVLP